MNEEFKPEIDPQPEEIRIIDDEKMKWTNSGYTVREYYSHSTPEKGPGPGWDFKTKVLAKYGIDDPSKLPDEPLYKWEFVEE